MRCDECKHWNLKDEGAESGKLLVVGVCTRAIPFWDATGWNKDGDRVVDPKYAGRKFFAQDGSDYRAIVLTMPDFFCAEHEAR